MPVNATPTTINDPGNENPDADNSVVSKPQTNSSNFPLINELEDYVSYNYVFTFSCLSIDEINNPEDTYRKSNPKIIILRSGGGVDGVTTEPENNGQVEYFIDNVEVDSIIAPNKKSKHTNATRIKFQVTEPYSMGIFLQELKQAALEAAGPASNYLEMPYLLTVEFKGWDDDGNYLEKKHLRRMWPMKLVNVTFNVTEAGCVYDVEAIPWVEQAATDQVQSIKADIKLVGSTVKEMLQTGLYSLSTVLNSREQERRRRKEVKTPDEFVIAFPEDSGEKIFDSTNLMANFGAGQFSLRGNTLVTKNQLFKKSISEKTSKPGWFDAELEDIEKTVLGVMVRRSYLGEIARDFADKKQTNNDIGRSKIVDNYLDGTKKPFSRPRFVELDDKDGIFERRQIQVSDNLSTLTFKTGTNIQDIIEEVILLSAYGREISDKKPDENGMISWFKIDLEVYNLDDSEQVLQSGKDPKIYVYKVLPYKTHVSRYNPVTAVSKIEALKKQCVKEYNYIYTGKNNDVIDFDISFNRAFFLASTPFAGKNKIGTLDANASRRAGEEIVPKAIPNAGGASGSKSGNNVAEEAAKPGTGSIGGGPLDKVANSVARDFNDAILNSTVDLINTSLVIWGDPYYIIDSGFGNYIAKPNKNTINLNADGTMNAHDGEVHILLNFRTPLDYPHTADADNDPSGFMDFYQDGTYSPSAFSGVYQVVQVMNSFSDGKFTQTLKLIRIRNQEKTDVIESAKDDPFFRQLGFYSQMGGGN